VAIHYGDYFNDPGKQLMPQAWQGLSSQNLLDSIYEYTYRVLDLLQGQGTTPSVIGIGNETTWGFIDANSATDGWQWPIDAEKFQAAFDAVDEFNLQYDFDIRKAVHFTESTAKWLTGLFTSKGITQFDIIGISYYPSYSPETDLSELGALISDLKTGYNKEVMVLETGFVWKVNGWIDNYNNILNDNGNVLPYPASPEGQRQYLLDLCQTVYTNGGSGVFYWEPAYISSGLCTLWGKGSPYENVCFFNFQDQNKALSAFDFFDFCSTLNTDQLTKLPYHISPNPTSGPCQISGPGLPFTLQIHDLNGRMIFRGQYFNTHVNLDLAGMAMGQYVAKIIDPQGAYCIPVQLIH